MLDTEKNETGQAAEIQTASCPYVAITRAQQAYEI